MSDTDTPVEPTAPAATPTATPPAEPDPKDWQAEAEKWKALSRKNEADAKSNAEAARRLAEIEDQQKTEAERLAERVTAAEERAAKATRAAVAARVEALATDRFADPQDAVDALGTDFLSEDGSVDPDSIRTALDALLERKPHWAKAADAGPRTPRPDPSQGPRPGGTVGIDDRIREARAKGDWRTALSLENSKLATIPTPK